MTKKNLNQRLRELREINNQNIGWVSNSTQIKIKYKYILKPSGLETSKIDIKAALNASVSAIYFSDRSDYRSYHYKVIHALTGTDEDSEVNIRRLFNELNPE